MTTSSFARRSRRLLAALALPLSLCIATAAAAVDLADKPLFSTTSVPGNLLLDLSVEYPTANSSAYFSTAAYSGTTLYVGYFDGAKCYSYKYGPAQSPALTAAQSYFQPVAAATSTHTCSASSKQWSGNYLNYASMQGLDIFRWVLTGGNRVVDQTTAQGGMTILQRATHSGQGGSGDAPNKTLSATYQANSTPIPSSFGAGLNTRVWGAGIQLWITSSATMSATTIPNCNSATPAPSPCTIDYQDDNVSTMDGTKIYGLYMNVRVCDPSVSVEANCVLYGSTYKPEGLMQQYSQTLRYGAFGYLNDSSTQRDAGVLRARMAYIAPQVPVPGAPATTNPNPEWDATTGVMATNPDSSDANDTKTNTGVVVTQSGVMNYLNKFGYTSGTYKTYDPVSELYYASIRYLKGQSNVSAYTAMGTTNAATKATYVDGFPVISQWTVTSGDSYDPILYACQKNFVLGIGDVNTHRDGNLPGSSLTTAEPTMPTEVSSDTTINVTTATNYVGTMEGTNTTLGQSYTAQGDYSTYYIAGIAYDAHIPLPGHGLRSYPNPNYPGDTTKNTISTVSTYWLDVQEYQTYVKNNIYYYATKYGGFTVPDSGYTIGTAPSLGSWYTSTNYQPQGSTSANGQKQPDNYFTASNATAMQAGLQSAFAKIAAANGKGSRSSLNLSSPNVSSTGSTNYSATYDPKTWTGTITADAAGFADDGTPTFTQSWDAGTLLSATSVTPGSRKIVTCCTTSAASPGVPFTSTALSAATLISRTNTGTFTNVQGVAAASQSSANYIAYLRGDTTQELANGGVYRSRVSRLGDIVDSKLLVVSAPAYLMYDTYNPGYSAFKSTWANRKPVVYAGANDGMLHAFDGTTGNATSGAELFGYIPSFVYGTSTTGPVSGLASLGNPSFVHHYLVDGLQDQFDVDFTKTAGNTATAPNWHTLLIGGLGKGGNGYYALDITDPSYPDETTIASKVLWEFTAQHMGYTYGLPSVIKTKKYGWVVVFTSGYNNDDGMGYFYIVNPVTGALLEPPISTPIGSGTTSAPLNLGQQSAYVENYSDMTADAIYAGDLQGNLWRLDLSGTDPSVPYATPTKIAAFGSSQPISTRVLIEVPPNTNTRIVLVGTGELLGDSDIASGAQQSFYAITDGISASGAFYGSATQPLPNGVTFPITRSQLNADSSQLTGISSSPASVMGWYFDLPVTSGVAERVNIDPFAVSGIVTFSGNLPGGSVCYPSGSHDSYVVNYATGKTVLTNGAVSLFGANLISDNVIVSKDGSLTVLSGATDGTVVKVPTSITTSTGVTQVNWRDVPTTN